MRFLIFIFLAFAKTQRYSITWFEHLSVFHLISITLCAWLRCVVICVHSGNTNRFCIIIDNEIMNIFQIRFQRLIIANINFANVGGMFLLLLLGNHYRSVIKSSLESIGFDITIKSKNESFSRTFLHINVSLKLADWHIWFLMSVYICSIFQDA